MSYFPCPNHSDCVPPAEGVAVRNFSSEGPDRASFFGLHQCLDLGPNPPFETCTSIISQQQADWCAARCLVRGVFINTEQIAQGGCADSEFRVPEGIFLANTQLAADLLALNFATASAAKLCSAVNSAQTCNIVCADNTFRSATTPAGQIKAVTQTIANQLALALACDAASLSCFGSLTFNTEQTCEVPCPLSGGFARYTILAGTISGLSQSSASERALELACQLALLSCSELPPLVSSNAQSCSQLCDGVTISQFVPAGAFVGLTQAEADATAILFCVLSLSAACQEGQPPEAMNVGNQATACVIPCAGGGTFTSAIQAGAFRLENQAAANQAAISYCNAHIFAQSFCLGAIDAGGCVNSVYASVISITGPGTPAVMGIVSGTLPPGISLSSTMLSGIFTTPGTYSFSVRAADSNGNFAQRDYTITVAEIQTVVLVDGSTSAPYAQAIMVAGFTNPTFTIVGGALPDPLTLHPATGVISGDAPTEDGDFAFVVQVQDSNATCLQDYVLTVEGSPFCDDLVWGAPVITPSAPVAGTGSATASECTFHLEATAPGFPDSSGGNQVVDILGQESYTGPAMNLNLHLIVSGISGNMGNSDIVIQLDGNPLVIITNEDTNGTYDFPFTIPVSVAAQFTIQCTMIANGSAGAAAGTWDGTLSVVP